MKWEAVGAIGQVVSALALVLVLVQLIDTREEMERSANRARLEGTRDMYLLLATTPELGAALKEAHTAAGSKQGPFREYLDNLELDGAEVEQVTAYMAAMWQNFQISIMARDRLSPGVRIELDRQIVSNFGPDNRVGNAWFEMRKPARVSNPDAVSYVAEVLARPSESL